MSVEYVTGRGRKGDNSKETSTSNFLEKRERNVVVVSCLYNTTGRYTILQNINSSEVFTSCFNRFYKSYTLVTFINDNKQLLY